MTLPDGAGRVIITGGTGLIGRALSAALVREGREVVVLSRDPDRYTGGMEPGVRLSPWDGKTADGWAALAENAEAVVNLAGASLAGWPWTAKRRALIRQSRLHAARAVVDAASATGHPPKVLIQASAVGYYGPLGNEPVDESAGPGQDFLARLVVEHETEAAKSRSLGMRMVAARTGVVLANAGGALPLMSLPFRLFLGGPLGSGRQYISWIHIADEVAAIQHLIRDERADGPCNLTAPTPVTNAEFAQALGRALRRPSALRVPGFVLRLALGQMATVVLDGQNVLPQRLTSLGFAFRYRNVEAALSDIFGAGPDRDKPASC